ncbi:LacI family DNA-binding transcriptional regulator [Leifsonia sp. fls2-241-R2A-40a]|uniref:LacI family DNA-binding transcriptional regulator n=1 Tax=Leifsonia sp. fls2-241-R2A-40a TaxID=3040290 RepID=UPI0025517FAD|nr:LacI family DNA-binding transcriptional regulator [Leifsonia sp. fls2-241-R2A-40a]
MASDSTRPRQATIHDVAAAAGLSRGTVSRVINGEPYVSPAAKAAVESAIIEVGYVPNTAARNLKTRRSGAVALIVHEPHSLFLEDPNIGAIVLGTNSVLSDADYQLVTLVVDSNRDSERVADYLRGGFVDGVIIISARAQDPIGRAATGMKIPAVFVGHPPGLADIVYVGIDNVSAARTITERLLATGRKRVGMIASALDRDSGQDRLAGFREALGERFDPDLVVEYPFYSYDSGLAGMRELLARDPGIDGVFAASDAIAAAAIDVLRAHGKAVPQEVGVVGFDDSAWALRSQPQLSTVHQPAMTLGQEAARLVLQQIAGDEIDTAGVILQTEITWRESA